MTTPFDDLGHYVALPRLSGLALAPDGSRLVTVVAAPDPEDVRYVSALWEVDPAGERPARRLTRSAKGESSAAFAPDGSLLFTSARPDASAKAADPDDATPALWSLPPGGGEARVVATRPGGITGFAVARAAGTVAVLSPTLPGSVTADDDAERRARRRDGKVTAMLHDGYPVRFWDTDLGPDRTRLLAGALPPPSGDDERVELRDLTPAPGLSLLEAQFDVAPDGTAVFTTWQVAERAGGRRAALARLDPSTGAFRLVADDPEREFFAPRVSPDGRAVAVLVENRSLPERAPSTRLGVVDVASGDLRLLATAWDRWPTSVVWSPDGATLFVTADDEGRGPVFRIDLATETVVRLTTDDGCYTDLQVSPDGASVFALRSAVDAPPVPVRLDARTPGRPVLLRGPAPAPELPGRLTEVTATADDGTPLRAWLALPGHASARRPAPLLLWIHGGPLGSWNAWSWRWNPWLMVARGYAVLLPDPALSTGYGQHHVDRGWGAWGAAPYTDLMTVTDAAERLDAVDATRTAAMGGSFGGYMANWVAGHTDRFRGIVTHASLWALDQFGPTTDAAYYWRREMTAQMMHDNSPHRFVDEIRTPMLVVHGDKDYRVPIGEALRLWADLCERSGEGGETPHKFLYFPTEHHWVLAPNHAGVWYRTVFAFLAHTVLGEPWQVPDLLR